MIFAKSFFHIQKYKTETAVCISPVFLLSYRHLVGEHTTRHACTQHQHGSMCGMSTKPSINSIPLQVIHSWLRWSAHWPEPYRCASTSMLLGEWDSCWGDEAYGEDPNLSDVDSLDSALSASGKFGGVAGVLAGVHSWNRDSLLRHHEQVQEGVKADVTNKGHRIYLGLLTTIFDVITAHGDIC